MSFFGNWLRRAKRHRPPPPPPPVRPAQLLAATAPASSSIGANQGRTLQVAASTVTTASLQGSILAPATGHVAATTTVAGGLQANAQQPVISLTNDNWAYRSTRFNVVRRRHFDTSAEVGPHMQTNGTYLADTTRAAWITDPAIIAPGATGCLGIKVTTGGEPDTRNPTQWQGGGVRYVTGQACCMTVTIQDNPGSHTELRIFGCLSDHTSTTATPASGPVGSANGPSLDGGDTTYWHDYGTSGTGSGDSSVQWVDTLSSAFEADVYSGFGPGSMYSVMVRVKLSDFFLRSSWQTNNNAQGGWKLFMITSKYAANIGRGQQWLEINRYRGGCPVGHMQDPNYNNICSPNNSEGWLTPQVNRTELLASGGDTTQQAKIYNRHVWEHPVTLATNGATRMDPNAVTGVQQMIRRFGHVDNQTTINNPSAYLPESGGFNLLRDAANQWVTFCRHHRIGTQGTHDSLVEEYIALSGRSFRLMNRMPDEAFYPYTDNGTTFAPPCAGVLPTTTGVLNAPMWHNGIWITFANTSRIRNSNQYTAVSDHEDMQYFQEVLVTTGPQIPVAPGMYMPTESDVGSDVSLSLAIRQRYRTAYRNALNPGEYCILGSAPCNGVASLLLTIPTEWRQSGLPNSDPVNGGAGNGGTGGYSGPDGRLIFAAAYSGFAIDVEHRCMWQPGTGAHDDTGNNQVAVLEMGGSNTTFGGWRLACPPDTVAAINSMPGNSGPGGAGGETSPTGKWMSRHTYDGACCTMDHRIMRVGGAAVFSGNDSHSLNCYDPKLGITGAAFTNYGAPPSGSISVVGHSAIFLPEYNCTLLMAVAAGWYAVFDNAANAFTAPGSIGRNWTSHAFATPQSQARGSVFWKPPSGGRGGEVVVVGSMTQWVCYSIGLDPNGRPQITGSTILLQNAYDSATPPNLISSTPTASLTGPQSAIDHLQSASGPAVCWDDEPGRGCAWWMVLNVTNSGVGAGGNPNRGRLGRLTPGTTAMSWVISEDIITPVGTWDGTAIVGTVAAATIRTQGPVGSYLSFPNYSPKMMMVDRGQDALVFLGGDISEPPFYLAKPA